MAADARIDFKVNYDTKGAQKSVGNLGTSVKNFAKAAGVAFAAKKILDFSKQSIEAYNLQVEGETKLTEVMTKRIGATDAEIKSVMNLAREEQKRGIFGDELIISGQQQLATFASTADTLKLLTPAMNNLVAQQKGVNAGTGDFVNIANLMGKALQGQVGALTRVGISFDETQEKVLKNGNEMERAAILAEVITDNVGDMNTALRQTDAGKIAAAENAIGDLKEGIGKMLIPLKVGFYEFLANTLVPFLTDDLVPALDTAWKAFSTWKPIQNVKDLMSELGGLKGMLAGAGDWWTEFFTGPKAEARGAFGNKVSKGLFGTDIVGVLSGIAGFFGISHRANGGGANSNQPYMVGERGPELFTPNTSGSITPNHKMGGGGSTMVNVYPSLSIGGEDIKVMVTSLVSDVLSQTRGVA